MEKDLTKQLNFNISRKFATASSKTALPSLYFFAFENEKSNAKAFLPKVQNTYCLKVVPHMGMDHYQTIGGHGVQNSH